MNDIEIIKTILKSKNKAGNAKTEIILRELENFMLDSGANVKIDNEEILQLSSITDHSIRTKIWLPL